MCNKQNFLYCFIHCCWPSLLVTAGPSTSPTGPSDSSTGMDPLGDVWIRQQPSGACFSYSKSPGPASASVLPGILLSNSPPSFSLVKFLTWLRWRLIAMLPLFVELVVMPVPGLM